MPNASGWQSLQNQIVFLQLTEKQLLLVKQGSPGSAIEIPDKSRNMGVYLINILGHVDK